MFAQMMIPHHQQAVLISQWELKQGLNPEVKKLATRIIKEQSPEILQMTKWIGSSMSMGHMGPMSGMVSQKDLQLLKSSKGKKFDLLYLRAMTSHHLGAISAAKPYINDSNPEVASLCKSIVRNQQAEINEIKVLSSKIN
jgi:uncharacterized protein (DUF305 family)